MTYEELKINTEIKLKEKPNWEWEKTPCRTVKYTVVAKYPGMCIVEDKRGHRRGVAVGELIMNKIIVQAPCFEALRCEGRKGWRKKIRS